MPQPEFIRNAGVPGEPPSAAFQPPRDFSSNRCVYTVISSRARGLSIGVNMNPDQQCNFNCLYCEVDRRKPVATQSLDIELMTVELREALRAVFSTALRSNPKYANLPPDLTKLRQVTLSGDGEPTLSPNFAEAVSAVIHLRARGEFPFFKIVLATNGSGLDRPMVVESLRLFGQEDEVWAKLDAGSREYFEKVNLPQVSLAKIMSNILMLARKRPVVIQSLFPMIDGHEPTEQELTAYTGKLQALKAAGAKIQMVQIYSANRPGGSTRCSHLPLKSLCRIAKLVKSRTGLPSEVF